jgi:nucleotide-binding universal stress UspA family protein
MSEEKADRYSEGEELKKGSTDEITDFIEKVNGIVHRMIKKPGLRYLVCVDGSDGGDLAYRAVKHLFDERQDHIVMYHAYKTAIQNQPSHVLPLYRPENVRRKYESQLIGDFVDESMWEIVMDERGENESALDTLVKHVDRYSYAWNTKPSPEYYDYYHNVPDFVLLGYVGRKGVKTSPTVLGSTADLALRKLHVPCIIAKATVSSGPLSFIYCVNASEKSRIGFNIFLQLIKPRDRLTILHVQNGHGEEKADDNIKETYEALMEKYGPRTCRFVSLPPPEEETVKEAIVNYINNSKADFVGIAPRAKLFLSEVSEYVVSHVRTSIVLCKN